MRFFKILISQFLTLVPNKFVPKTPYEPWSQKKTSLRHFHVWGCIVKVRPYNPQSKKLDPKTIRVYFIGIEWDQEILGFIARRRPLE